MGEVNLKRKILFTLLVVSLAIVAIGCASAALFDNENKVTIDGIDFNVPDGYKEDTNYQTINEVKNKGGVQYTVNGKVFEKGSDIVSILVSDYGEYKLTDDIVKSVGGDEKTIGDVKGYASEDDGYYLFTYIKDDKLVVFSVTDEDSIEGFLK